MEVLSGLLARYTNLFKAKQLEIELILKIIKKQTGLTIQTKELKLKDGILIIKTKSKYKLEIILKKQTILKQLNNQGVRVVELK